jgi:hypothetical protein
VESMANKAFVEQWLIAAIIVAHEIECSILVHCNLFFLIIINKGNCNIWLDSMWSLAG